MATIFLYVRDEETKREFISFIKSLLKEGFPLYFKETKTKGKVYPFLIIFNIYNCFSRKFKERLKEKLLNYKGKYFIRTKQIENIEEIKKEIEKKNKELLEGLREYQQKLLFELINILKNEDTALLLADVGLGKTWISLRAINYFVKKDNHKIVYLAPNNFVKYDGIKKIKGVLNLNDEEIVVIEKSDLLNEFSEKVNGKTKIIVIPYSVIKSLKKESFDLDEVSMNFLIKVFYKTKILNKKKVQFNFREIELLIKILKRRGFEEFFRIYFNTLLKRIREREENKIKLEKEIKDLELKKEDIKKTIKSYLEKILTTYEFVKLLYMNNFFYFIIDEIHYIKNPYSWTSMFLRSIFYYYRVVKKDFKKLKIIGMTATPFPNGEWQEIESYTDILFYKPLKRNSRLIKEKINELSKKEEDVINYFEETIEEKIWKILFTTTIEKDFEKLKNSFLGYEIIAEQTVLYFPSLEERNIKITEEIKQSMVSFNSADGIFKIKETIYDFVNDLVEKLRNQKISKIEEVEKLATYFLPFLENKLFEAILTHVLSQLNLKDEEIKEYLVDLIKSTIKSKENQLLSFIKEVIIIKDDILIKKDIKNDIEETEEFDKELLKGIGMIVYNLSKIFLRIENGFISKSDEFSDSKLEEYERKLFMEFKGKIFVEFITSKLKEGKKVLVFVPFVKQRVIIDELLKSHQRKRDYEILSDYKVLIHGKEIEKLKDLEKLPNLLVVGFFTKEGIDLKDYDVVLFLGIPYDLSYLAIYQAKGRVMRTFGEKVEKEVYFLVGNENTVEYFFANTHIEAKKIIQNKQKETILNAKKGGVRWEELNY